MQRKHWKPSIAFWLVAALSLTSATAQELKQRQHASSATRETVINIWPGVAPGSEQWKQPEGTLGSGDRERIVNVSTPTLSVYLPDPSTATGTAIIIAPGGGFVFLGMNSEGYDVAKWLVARGIRFEVPNRSARRSERSAIKPIRHGTFWGSASRPHVDRRGW
jgi:acetyl esterase/lipase